MGFYSVIKNEMSFSEKCMELETISEENEIQTNTAFFLSYAESRFKTCLCICTCTRKKEEIKGERSKGVEWRMNTPEICYSLHAESKLHYRYPCRHMCDMKAEERLFKKGGLRRQWKNKHELCLIHV